MRTLHLVSHTHWDREWYRTFQQFRLRLVHLVDNVLALLAEDLGFRSFSLDGQAIILEDYLAVRPERRAEIETYIRQGRLIVGPWYILPDEFLVSPEALIRNLLFGERVCAAFGPKMAVGYVPDPFGHIGQMPQILTGFGIQNAAVMRGLSDEPCEFWWQGPDGSAVFMTYLRDGYGNAANLPVNDPLRFCDEIIRLGDSLGSHSAATHLLLMFGTDHMEPPAETSKAIAYANDCLRGIQIVHSSLPAYLSAVQDQLALNGAVLPVVYGELRSPKRSPLLSGVLSTRMWIKQRNHACETLLERWAEPFSAWAGLVAADPARPAYRAAERLQQPAALLRQAWQLLLTCQPHDSICGCSIDQVHDEMRPRFDQVDQIGEAVTAQSLQALAEATDTTCDPAWAVLAIAVFNPMPGERTDLVEMDLELPDHVTHFEILDEYDMPMPHQVIGLGRQELIHMLMAPDEFLSATANVQDGRITGLVMRQIQINVAGEVAHVEFVLSENGEPDLAAFRKSEAELRELVKDPAIKRFEVRAHSADKVHLRFQAAHVPGPGERVFWVHPLPSAPSQPAQMTAWMRLALPLVSAASKSPVLSRMLGNFMQRRPKAKKPYFIQNEFLALQADPLSGTISLMDKRSSLVFDGLHQFTDGGDCGDEYNYCPPAQDELISLTRVRHVDITTGPTGSQMVLELSLVVPQSLDEGRKKRSAGRTTLSIRSTFSLWAGVPRLEIHTEVDNTASDHRLRVHFPTPFPADCADYDGHFGIVQRKLDLPAFDESWVERPRPEAPQRLFSSLSDGRRGLLLAARGLPEVEALRLASEGSVLALTLLRCVGWLSRDDLLTRKGHAGPGYATPGAQMPGKHSFDYALVPFEDPGEAQQLGRDFHAPLRAAATGLHGGALTGIQTLLKIAPLAAEARSSFVLSAIKQAESGQGLVVRGWNESSRTIQFRATPWRPFAHVELLRLDEKHAGGLESDIDGGVTCVAGPYQIITLKFSD